MEKLVAFFLGLFGLVNTQLTPSAVIPKKVSNLNQYSIASMSQRSYDSDVKIEKKFSESARFSSFDVSFLSDGFKQYALLNVPKGDIPNGGWPVVVVNHGHIEPSIYSTQNSYINTSAYFANAGFLVVKPDYRGHGRSEGDADGLLSRINYGLDVINLIYGVKKMDNVNPKKIFMYGHSMGGDVTLRVMEACPECARAATLWAPAVSDWPESFLYFSRRRGTYPEPTRMARLERRLNELKGNFDESEYDSISTLANVGLIQVPVNIQHGTADESVPYEWGVKLRDKFDAEKKEYNFYSYSNDNHDIARNWSVALNRDIELFRQVAIEIQ